ncbi:MAG: ABC-type nitrate/sulfonate/bicarbonate transport system, permease component [Betaproteobacteria bacterium]|nr:ABC-type nitrate/sulfonate/bicarbonate transport system, permease component [Betaproteobacteria bacterium]
MAFADAKSLPRITPRRIRTDLLMQRLALVGGLLAIWWLLSLRIPHYILPGPPRVYDAFKLIVGNGDLWRNLGTTLERVGIGFVLATIIAVPLGIMFGAIRKLGEFFEPVLPVLNTVSSAIWAIFAIIWFGVSESTIIFVVFMTAMPLVITNVWQGTRSVSADFIELAQILRMPAWKVMTKIYLPTIMPYFFSGARLAFGFGWRVSLVAETLGASSGVGYRLRQAADLVQTDQVFAWTITMIAMMAALEMGVLKPLENHIFRWRREAEAQ